ncbi:MAG TPA: glutaminase [Gammaproteobacteria bacterium]
MDLDRILAEIARDAPEAAAGGRVADYIPALGRVPANRFGMAAATLEGQLHRVGDADEGFSIQSVSKLFLLALVLPVVGKALWQRVGREPSGNPFNSLVQLEREQGIPRNPFINAGALVVVDVLLDTFADPLGELLGWLREESGDAAVEVDAEVAQSELDHADRNAALVHFMRSFGSVRNPVDRVLELYCRACAIRMSCAQLARAMLVLANHGVSPVSGRERMSRSRAKRINAVMLTCGTYDAAGEFAFRVGLPCKSGVGGGIVALIPGRLGLCAWSPPLDATGNSAAALAALDSFTTRTGWSVF